MQALLGFTSETRWLRYARQHLASSVPVSARPVRLQQAASRRGRAGPDADPGAGRRHRGVDRRHLADRLDPGRVRPVPAHRQAVRPGRLGRLRLLRQPLPLLLGAAPASGLHPRRAADHVRARQPQDRRTRSRPRPARDRTRPARPPARPDRHRRQGLRLRRVRDLPHRPRRPTAAPRLQERTAPPRRPAAQTAPPDHRVGQRHPQRPTRPRTPRRTHTAPASPPACSNASSPSPPPSGTTTTAANPSCDPSSPTTTAWPPRGRHLRQPPLLAPTRWGHPPRRRLVPRRRRRPGGARRRQRSRQDDAPAPRRRRRDRAHRHDQGRRPPGLHAPAGRAGAAATVRELLVSVAPRRIATPRAALDQAEAALAAAPDDTEAALRYAHVLAEWGEVGGYEAEAFWDVCTTRAVGAHFDDVAGSAARYVQRRRAEAARARGPAAGRARRPAPRRAGQLPRRRWQALARRRAAGVAQDRSST